jgi:hypothetical protein
VRFEVCTEILLNIKIWDVTPRPIRAEFEVKNLYGTGCSFSSSPVSSARYYYTSVLDSLRLC